MRDELVERMARAIYEQRNGYGCTPWNIRSRSHRDPYLADAAASLRAIEEAGAVVVPKEATGEMEEGCCDAMANGLIVDGDYVEFGGDAAQQAWSAMLAASPYAEKNNDTR